MCMKRKVSDKMKEYITLNDYKRIPRFLYKYGNLDNPQWFLDSLMNNRLYAGMFTEMNDPMEGAFVSKNRLTFEEYMRVVDEKKQNRFCSLTTSQYLHLMWAYYANGHKGYCIEIDMMESEFVKDNIYKIEYDNELPFLKNTDGNNGNDSVRNLLTHKYTDWAHEDEWRYFVQDSNFWEKLVIKKVYFGAKITKLDFNFYANIIKKLNPEICVKHMIIERLIHIDTTDKSKMYEGYMPAQEPPQPK